MRYIKRLLSYSVLICVVLSLASACNTDTPDNPDNTERTDYAESVMLDMTSETVKQVVTVKTYIDGDTTHFNVPASISESGVLKARYLAINTPESTGKIEEYGKKASAFTKEKLSGAASIMVESDTASWELDSTGGRHLVWVWYKANESDAYRNLNIEILQNGLAIASSSSNNRYGSTCLAAIAQAKSEKLNLHSGQKDPDFYYGEAIELTLKELRCNCESYNGMKVAFNGVITKNSSNSVYLEDYDPETNMYYGMTVYYGYNLTGEGLDILSVGNLARIVGTVQYYEAGGTYQVSGVNYRLMKPDDPNNIRKLSDGNEPAYVKTEPDKFKNGKVAIVSERDGEVKNIEFDYAELAMNTSLSMDGLHVKSIYTTANEDSSSFGAMTLTCDAGGIEITVRTLVLYDQNNKIITEDAFRDKVINVKGLVDYYNGVYQIKVFSANDITINN